MKLWEREYILSCYPNLSSQAEDKIQELYTRADLDSDKAKTFHQGWDAAIYHVETNMNKIIYNLTRAE